MVDSIGVGNIVVSHTEKGEVEYGFSLEDGEHDTCYAIPWECPTGIGAGVCFNRENVMVLVHLTEKDARNLIDMLQMIFQDLEVNDADSVA